MEKQVTSSPHKILQVGTSFFAAKTLLAAVEFELFTKLAKCGATKAAPLKSELGLACSDRHFYDFLDALASFGFLKRDGLLESALYSNSEDTDMFLDKNKPSYIGGILTMANHRLYGFWGNLEDGLRSGKPQNEMKDGSGSMFEKLYSDPVRLEEFLNAMSGVQAGNFMTFSKGIDLSGVNTLVDIGGAGALCSLILAKDHKNVNCISADLPPVGPIAQKNIDQAELSDRVRTMDVDFFQDEFPKAELIIMGNILHDWDEETKRMLIKKAYDALPEGGRFVAIEYVIDNERSQNTFGLLMSLNMLIELGTGFDYTFNDFNGWIRAVGFSRMESMPLAGPASAVIAYK